MDFGFNQKSCPWLVKKSLFSKPGQRDKDACLATKGPCQQASCAPHHWVTYKNINLFHAPVQTEKKLI